MTRDKYNVISLLALCLKPKNLMKHKKASIKLDSKKTAERGSNEIKLLDDKNSSYRIPLQAEFRK